nr:hypothetical protein BaRGS_014515 [Batillaria attramentaria]
MMAVSQTQPGAASQKVDALKPKRRTRVACWNVRTLYQTGKLAQVVREFDEYRLDILGVSEARSGKRRLASGHTILYSGNQHQTNHPGSSSAAMEVDWTCPADATSVPAKDRSSLDP